MLRNATFTPDEFQTSIKKTAAGIPTAAFSILTTSLPFGAT